MGSGAFSCPKMLDVSDGAARYCEKASENTGKCSVWRGLLRKGKMDSTQSRIDNIGLCVVSILGQYLHKYTVLGSINRQGTVESTQRA
jgi:hypothetical protein